MDFNSIFAGLVSHGLFIISSLPFLSFLCNIKIYDKYRILSIYFYDNFTISQRMIPFFTTAKAPDYKINKSENLLKLVFIF